MSDQNHRTTRGRFLSVATVGLGAAVGGVVAAPTLGYVLSSAAQKATFKPVSLGPVSRFTSESSFNPTPAAYVEDPNQPATSTGLAYVHHTGHTNREWLAPDAMFVVFSNRCTHVGCPAQATDTGFACPCHGSVFDRQGGRIAGPALRPLDRFQWEIRRNRELWVTQLWSVLIEDGRASYFAVKSPGQPLTGQVPFASADILYPPVTYNHGRPPNSR